MPVASLPDELVLMIIDTCDHLEKDREKTLAALCRLAKRYKGAAERLLYSRVELQPHGQGQPGVPGTALHTLARRTTLRPYVKSVDLNIERKHAQDAHVWGVLQDLPNIEEIMLHLLSSMITAGDRFLGHGHIHLRGIRAEGYTTILRDLMQRHPAAFAALTRLDLEHLPAPVPPSYACTSVTSFSLNYLTAPDTFATFTSTFSACLTSLRLPLTTRLTDHTLAGFWNLEQLSLFRVGLNTEWLEEAIPCVKAFLATAASLPSFISLAIEGTLVVDNSGRGCNPPLWIQHLSLVTSFFRAEDVASYLLGPLRPPALRTLRLGGCVGEGFKEFAGTKKAWYAAFEWKMEKAGIELTTVG